MQVWLVNLIPYEYPNLREFTERITPIKTAAIALGIVAAFGSLWLLRSERFAYKFSPRLFLESPIFNKNWNTNSREDFFKYHLNKHLEPLDKGIAFAIDNGDCFFDSVAQALTATTQLKFTVKDVRLHVSDYVEMLHQENPKNWVQQSMEDNVEDDYDTFRKFVGLTTDESSGQKNGAIIWGNNIIAKIVAKAYNIQMRIYSLGTYECDLQEVLDLRMKNRHDEIYKIFAKEMTAEILFVEDDIFFMGEESETLIEIACYTAGPSGHFYPVFNKLSKTDSFLKNLENICNFLYLNINT